MTEAVNSQPIQQTSELTFMKSKYPGLKQKLSQPYPYFYQLKPKDEETYNKKLAEFAQKLKENSTVQDQVNLFQAIGLGRIEGMSGTLVPSAQLAKLFSFQNKQFWLQFTNQKITQKNYGLQKQKTHLVWQVKDIEILKQIFDIQQLKKQRKVVKQYSTFYKAGHKFIQKFDKLKMQSEIQQLYEQYKKFEQEESKYNKLVNGEKNKPSNISKVQAVIHQTIPIFSSDQPKVIQKQENKIQQENQNEQGKVQNIQQQVNKAQNNEEKVEEKPEVKPEGKKSKKKAEPKQPASNKKQNKSIDKQQQFMSKFFLKKKQPEPESGQKMIEQEKQNEKIDKTDTFLSMLSFNQKSTVPSISELKKQFSQKKPVTSDPFPKKCYVNIILNKSRLQFYDFPIKEVKANFADPFATNQQNIRYDDSSDEYSELVADSINQEMVQDEEEQEEDQEQSNSAIVSDGFCQYKSSHIFSSSEDSSDEQQNRKIKPQMAKPVAKWFFGPKDFEKKEKYAKYDMICLIQDALPIITKDQAEQNSDGISPTQKIEMYKQIHGSYTPKDTLIRKLNGIVENKITMNKLSSLIKDICEKKGNQRVLKNQMIKQLAEEMAEINGNLQAQFEQIRNQRELARNQQMESKRQEKLNERDQKLQKLIMDYQGLMTTNSILQYLKQNQIKLLKAELNSIIKTKQGQKWQQIRNQIRKSKLIKGTIKKPKTLKPKMMKQQQIMQSHRPIDEIMKQNQLDMANRPKKQKNIVEQVEKQKDGEMVNENVEEIVSEQYHEPSDDESFQLKQKTKKKGKNKSRKIVKLVSLPPAFRSNPKRSKRKSKTSKKSSQNQQTVKQNNEQNEIQGEEEQNKREIQQSQDNKEGQQKLQNKKQNKNEMEEQSMKDQAQAQQGLYLKQKQGQLNNMQSPEQQQQQKNSKKISQTKQMENIKSSHNMTDDVPVSPLRNEEMGQKNQQVNSEQTANKLVQGEQAQSELR